MAVFTVTKREAQAFKDYFPGEIYRNIDKSDYYTLASLDDEDFVAGVLQFFVGFDENKGTFSRICYLFVPEEFSDSDAAALLLWEYGNILADSGIDEKNREMMDDENVFACSCSAESLSALESIKDVKAKDIYSISFIENADFVKIKKQVANGAELEQKRFYDDEISSFYRKNDDCGLLLAKKDSSDTLVINFIETDSPDRQDVLKGLLAYSAKRVADQYGKERLVRIECTDYESLDKLREFIPEITPELSEE